MVLDVAPLGGDARDAIHSLRWSGSKNKQGFLSLTPFTRRVMSLGPVMGGGHPEPNEQQV